MCTLALSHELRWNEIGYEGVFCFCFPASRVAQLVTCVSLMPEGHKLSLITAEAHYLLLSRNVHLPYFLI